MVFFSPMDCSIHILYIRIAIRHENKTNVCTREENRWRSPVFSYFLYYQSKIRWNEIKNVYHLEEYVRS